MNILETLIAGLAYRYEGLLGRLGKYIYPQPKVLNSFETLEKIQRDKCSLCRLGDGEFNLIFGQEIGFQQVNQKLSNELRQVLRIHDPRILVGIPDVFGDMSEYRRDSRRFWEAYLGRNRKKMLALLDLNTQYANTNVSRFQTGYQVTNYAQRVVAGLKKIWYDRDIVIIEGSKTRLGVGNDLFTGAKSIQRALVPPVNAYERKQEILDWICNHIPTNRLLVLACGPTATVMIKELSGGGYQALDLGHIDIQYEYYLRGITKKQAIKGKWVNESSQKGVVEEILNSSYEESIIYIFESK